MFLIRDVHNYESTPCAGQLIALQAFVPPTIRKKLARLQDDMPPMPREQALSAITRELALLGQDISIFEYLDLDHVLGCASIAQVHRGRLRNGGVDVAVKLQFPGAESIMMRDLSSFRLLGEVLQRTELKFDLVGPIKELSRQLRSEFDFTVEASSMNEIRAAVRHIRGVELPRSVAGLTTRRLLVMTYLKGIPMTQLESKIALSGGRRAVRYVGKKVLKRLAAAYGEMILSRGFFQV